MHQLVAEAMLPMKGSPVYLVKLIPIKERVMDRIWFNKVFIICFVLAIPFFSSSCALKKDTISMGYTPQENIDKIHNAEKVRLHVNITDARNMKDKVSYKKNAYGMELAEIVSSTDVTQIVRTALESELRNRGFIVNNSGINLDVTLIKFFSDFKTGFWSGEAVAEVIMSVQVKQLNNQIPFNKVINGNYTNPNIQLASGKNAQIALDGALGDAVSKLVNDPSFIAAIMTSEKGK